jgi:hypothetical protein
MRRSVVLLLLLATACAHVDVSMNSGTVGAPPPSPGTTLSTGSAGLQVGASGSAALVVLTVMLVSAATNEWSEPRSVRAFPSLSDWWFSPPPPQMSADRSVSEQDCTRPLETTGNLRCR